MNVMIERTRNLAESVVKMGKTENKLIKMTTEVNQRVRTP
jgi:hypothetical protein